MVPRIYQPGVTQPIPELLEGIQDPNLRVVDGNGSEVDAFQIEFNAVVIKNKDFKKSYCNNLL